MSNPAAKGQRQTLTTKDENARVDITLYIHKNMWGESRCDSFICHAVSYYVPALDEWVDIESEKNDATIDTAVDEYLAEIDRPVDPLDAVDPDLD